MNRHPAPSLRETLSYRVDNLMAWNPLAKLVALAVVSGGFIVFGGLAWWSLVHGSEDPLDGIFTAWTFMADAGTHADQQGFVARAFAVGITLGGIMGLATFIGLVTDAIMERVEELKKGRSRVIEEGHTLILGWDDKLLPLIDQLVEANASAGGGVITILSEREKEAMEDELRPLLPTLRGTRLVCRTGNTRLPGDLLQVAADRARAVVVLGTDDAPESSDARAIKTVLALRRLPARAGHIVVEAMSRENRELFVLAGGGEVEPIVAHDLIGRLMIQTARQPGLAQVYTKIMGFQGDEFYLKEFPALVGRSFGEVTRCFATATVCGLKAPGARGAVIINPPDDRTIAAGEELLVLAADDDAFQPGPPAPLPDGALPAWTAPPRRKEQLLFCGWRRDLDDMLLELDEYVGPGSTITILAELPQEGRDQALAVAGLTALKNLTLEHRVGDPSSRKVLEALRIQRFDSILILADETRGEPAEEVDARDLVTLLLVRDIQARHGKADACVIAEIRDPRTKELVTGARASDYVVSNEIVSMLLAQVAERRELAAVYADLFSAVGSEVYLKTIRRYAAEGERLGFRELSARARLRGELCLGWFRPEEGTPVLNPADKQAQLSWGADDQLVVLAELEG